MLVAVLAGAALRLAWGRDIEYKADEAWTFEHSRRAELLWVGMPSSVGVDNPGMSLWAFVLLQRLSGAEDPPALARAVQGLNVAALALLAVFAWRCVRRPEREAWLWAAALVAVNPLAVLFHRKLWPPCLMPLLTLALLYGWWRRDRRGPAFLWGLAGACLGQLHLSGFFFAAAFALWALLFGRRGPLAGASGSWEAQKARWGAWLAGSVLGALPLVPWLWHVLGHPAGGTPAPGRWLHALEGKFWMRWLTESFGLGIEYTLEQNFPDFLRGPLLAGRPTYLMGLMHVLLAGIGLYLLARAGRRAWAARRLVDARSPTGLAVGAALVGFGLLLTLSGCPLHRHYMIVLFPLEFVWVARLALASPRPGRVLLAALWAAQLLVSAGFLAYVHDRQDLGGEYGVAYSSQARRASKGQLIPLAGASGLSP